MVILISPNYKVILYCNPSNYNNNYSSQFPFKQWNPGGKDLRGPRVTMYDLFFGHS